MLGQRIGLDGPVWLKAEHFQKTGSFKARGALNKIETLSAEEKARGVITVSAGQPRAGGRLGRRAAGVRGDGRDGEIGLADEGRRPRANTVRRWSCTAKQHRGVRRDGPPAPERGLTLVHPFDDPLDDRRAGDGRAGDPGGPAELRPRSGRGRRHRRRVGIGGGGLISRPRGGAQGAAPRRADHRRRAGGRAGDARGARCRGAVPLTPTQTIADGLAAPFVGELTLVVANTSG